MIYDTRIRILIKLHLLRHLAQRRYKERYLAKFVFRFKCLVSVQYFVDIYVLLRFFTKPLIALQPLRRYPLFLRLWLYWCPPIFKKIFFNIIYLLILSYFLYCFNLLVIVDCSFKPDAQKEDIIRSVRYAFTFTLLHRF